MCGIAGILHFDRSHAVERRHIEKMCAQMVHRGPNDEGIYLADNIALGMRRLSIIDIASGHQPMTNEDESIQLVFNGEIYNYPELRKDLIARGHTFKTHSDTETIVHLYEEHGEDFAKFLRGMFAVAIWDIKARKLILARDHVGKKPLYYRLGPNGLSFGSELRLILEDGNPLPQIDHQAIYHYLSFEYIPGPLTIYDGVRKLPAAHVMVCEENGTTRQHRYWELSFAAKSSLSFADARDEMSALIEASVVDRLMSEVPLGAFLSGGIDSSLIVAYMQMNAERQIKTYAVGFDNEMFDETAAAQTVADHLGTDHTTLRIAPNFIEELPKIAWHFAEPFADPSALPMYFLCREAKQHITVALTGDGGDEGFAGYSRYAISALSTTVDRLPTWFTQRVMPGLLNLFPDKGIDRSVITAGKEFLHLLKTPQPQRDIEWGFFFRDDQKHDLMPDSFIKSLDEQQTLNLASSWFNGIASPHHLERYLGYDTAHYLVDDILVKADICSMAHSLELRSPLLDYRVLEAAARLPIHWKLNRRLTTKYILKKIAERYLPKGIIQRRKRGFTPPLAIWFRQKYNSYITETLLESKIVATGFVDRTKLQKLIEDHKRGRADHSKRLWALLMLEHWLRL